MKVLGYPVVFVDSFKGTIRAMVDFEHAVAKCKGLGISDDLIEEAVRLSATSCRSTKDHLEELAWNRIQKSLNGLRKAT